MFIKSDIRRVTLVIAKSRFGDFIVRLGEKGIVHISSEIAIPGLMHKSGDPPQTDADIRRIARICDLADNFIKEHPGSEKFIPAPDILPHDIQSLFSKNYAADENYIKSIQKKTEQCNKLRIQLRKLADTAMKRLDLLMELQETGIDPYRLKGMKLCSFICGTAKNMDWKREAGSSWFYIINGDLVLVILPATQRETALNLLRRSGFEDMSSIAGSETSIDEAISGLRKRIHELNRRIEKIEKWYSGHADLWSRDIGYMSFEYSVLYEIVSAGNLLNFTDEVLIMNGWINKKNEHDLKELLGDVCRNSYYLRVASRSENRRFSGRIPVLLKNSRLFRPFELLVKMMGLPGNSEIDPTPAAAIAYVVTFGVMFGDVGQGPVLAAAGVVLNLYGGKKRRPALRDFGSIITACGISATVTGFLYGSIFSNEHLIPALLFHPMEHMTGLFMIAVMMGVVFISTGVIFNIVNGLISGDYEEAFFGTKGVAGIAAYIAAIFFVMRYVLGGVEPSVSELAAAGIPPLLLFSLRGPLSYILFHYEKMFPHGLFEYAVETVIELLEMFSGFLGNTISFIRAGAFALSHAGLSVAIYTLARIVDPDLNSVAAYSVIVIGNIFIILLEGLVCGIQSMRLEYYEFFGKFFRGGGVPFKPFSLRNNALSAGG